MSDFVQFRRDMAAAYANITRHMPDHGQQVVMFTHQDAGVWADLGAILWAAGLRVTVVWNIVTETGRSPSHSDRGHNVGSMTAKMPLYSPDISIEQLRPDWKQSGRKSC